MHKGCAALQLALHLPSASSHPNLVTINKLKHGALATAWLFAAKPCRFNNPIIVYVPNCISRFNNWCTKRLWKVFEKLVSFSQSGIQNGQRKSEPVMLVILEVFANLNNFMILLLMMVITQELLPTPRSATEAGLWDKNTGFLKRVKMYLKIREDKKWMLSSSTVFQNRYKIEDPR